MSKIEIIIVGLFIGIACPLLTFVIFWWSAALLHMFIPDFSESIVMASALTGLSLGLLLDMLYLRQWVRGFYMINIWLLFILYLGLVIVAVAFFMGLPVGTIVIGISVGLYMGRRESYLHIDEVNTIPILRRTALFAASVTAMAALPIGILALNEQDIIKLLVNFSGFDQSSIQGFVGFILIGLLCVILFLIQYWFSKRAGLLAFNMCNRNT